MEVFLQATAGEMRYDVFTERFKEENCRKKRPPRRRPPQRREKRKSEPTLCADAKGRPPRMTQEPTASEGVRYKGGRNPRGRSKLRPYKLSWLRFLGLGPIRGGGGGLACRFPGRAIARRG